MGNCVDCGKEAMGIRCRKCHGALLRQRSLDETAQSDRELLDMVDNDKLVGQRLADRLGVTRTRALQKVHEARRRQEVRLGLSGEQAIAGMGQRGGEA